MFQHTIYDATTNSGNANYTMFAIGTRIKNGVIVASIGANESSAISIKLKLAQRTSSGNYTIVVDESYSHGGTGWEDCTLATPYQIPATGDYYLGMYCAVSNAPLAVGPRAYNTGDFGLGAQTGFTEPSNSYVPALRYSASVLPIGSSTAVESETATPTIATGAGWTMFARNLLFNGLTVSKIGVYATSALTFHLKLARRVSSTEYDVVVNESYDHGGTGWEDCTLASPYAIPSSGNYCVGAWCASNFLTFNDSSALRTYKAATDATGDTTGWTEDIQYACGVRVGIYVQTSFNQRHFRFRTDGNAVDATPTWGANEDAA